ncbi:hypothetical protein BD309DRAFT_982596 [Dichomitus squalens]|nr:hypothetical protein BD309DRAFT_982596 [Dichomitus squalens]
MIPENSRYLVHHLSLQANAVDDMLESMIAPNLSFLSNACGVRAVPHAEVYRRLQLPQLPAAQYIPTPHGIQMQIPVISLPHCFADTAVWYTEEIPQPQWYLAVLGCEHNSGVEYLYCKNLDIHHRDYSLLSGFSLVPLSPTIIARCRGSILLKTVYISLPALTGRPSHSFNEDFNETINLILRKKTCDALRTEGYTAELQSPDPSHATTHCLTLSRLRESYKITIEYQHTFAPITHELRIKAYASLSWPVDHSVEEIEAVPSFAEWQSFVAPWQWTSSTEKLAFFLGTSKITVELGFHYAGQSHYFLHVVIDRSRELSEDERREPWETWQPGPDFRPSPPPSPIVSFLINSIASNL